jgi:hypothetical protein
MSQSSRSQQENYLISHRPDSAKSGPTVMINQRLQYVPLLPFGYCQIRK